jgi:helix-turn-helix protein
LTRFREQHTPWGGGSPRCRGPDHHIRRSSGRGSSSWHGRGARRRSWGAVRAVRPDDPNWLKQADRNDGRPADDQPTEERDEVRPLRREVKALREEREIVRKPRPGSPGRPTRSRPAIRVREGAPGHAPAWPPCAACWACPPAVLRVAVPAGVGAGPGRPALLAQIRAIHDRSGGTYGAPRIHAELAAEGITLAAKGSRASCRPWAWPASVGGRSSRPLAGTRPPGRRDSALDYESSISYEKNHRPAA